MNFSFFDMNISNLILGKMRTLSSKAHMIAAACGWGVIFAAVAALAWVGGQAFPVTTSPNHLQELSWAPALSDADKWRVPVNRWREDIWWGAAQRDRAFWVRAKFTLSEEDIRRGTSALRLSGVFASTVYVNGQIIGAKGVPALRKEDEQTGPIDALLPLGDAARSGQNELLLFVSSHHVNYRARGLFHELAISAYGGDPRRSMTRYALAISQAGILAAFCLAFLWGVSRQLGDRLLVLAATGAGMLVIALLAETARSWWNYPYSLHGARLFIVWLGLTAFSYTVLLTALVHFSVSRIWAPSIFCLFAFGLSYLMIDGFDTRIFASLTIGIGAALLVAVSRALTSGGAAIVVCCVLAVLLAYLWINPAQFIDNGVYIFGSLLLFMLAPRIVQLGPAALGDAPDSAAPSLQLVLNLDGQERSIAYKEIILIKAAGNYIEIRFMDGASTLLRKTLSELTNNVHPPIMRVHRSHFVNLSYARRLTAKTGSRYELEMTNGEIVPVSRKIADIVRKDLSQQ